MNKDLQYIPIETVDDLITAYDVGDLPTNYALALRGSRQTKDSMIFEKDFGTKHLYATYPTLPSAITIVNHFKFYDKSNDTEYDIVVGYDSSSNLHIYAYDATLSANIDNPSSANNWIEITRTMTAIVNGTPTADALVASLTTIKDSLGATYTPITGELQGWTCLNVTKNTAVFVNSSTANSITVLSPKLGSNGLAWADTNQLIFYKNNWMYDNHYKASPTFNAADYNLVMGTTPHMRWLPIEAQRKVNLALGTSVQPPVMNKVMQIRRRDSRNLFYNMGGSSWGAVLRADWYAEKAGGLTNSFASLGTAATPHTPATGSYTANLADDNGDVWGRIDYDLGNGLGSLSNCSGIRLAITVVYDDYQESDPIFRLYAHDLKTQSPYVVLKAIRLNLAKMNKNITQIKIYGAMALQEKEDAGWIDADSDYVLFTTLKLNSTAVATLYDGTTSEVWNWSAEPTNVVGLDWKLEYTTGSYTINPTVLFSAQQVVKVSSWPPVSVTVSVPISSASIALDKALLHPTSSVRAYIKPRFMVKASRPQQVVSVYDKDDTTLLLSTYDGYGVHDDDNFPDITSDSLGNRQKVYLYGKGQMLGIGNSNNTVVIFRESELETYDLISGIQGVQGVDFYARLSLLKSDYGLTWAGKSAIYWLPEGGGGIQVLNPSWRNLFDGSLRIDDGSVQFVTDTYRSAIVSGYDPKYRSIWFQIQMNKNTADGGSSEYLVARYFFETRRWSFRKFNIGSPSPAVAYSRTKDGQTLIAYAAGLLKYPNVDTGANYTNNVVSNYEDDVTSADATASKGIESDIIINIRELYNQVQESVLCTIQPVFTGSSKDGMGRFQMMLYANRESTAFDTQDFPIDEIGEEREVERYGQMDALRVRIIFPTTGLSNFKDFNLSRIICGFAKVVRPGNV